MRYHTLLESGYQEGPDSTATHDGKEYQLDTIFKLATYVPVVQFPLYELAWMLELGEPTPERLLVADTSIPIIITPWQGKYAIVDGFHRTYKATKAGDTHIPAKIIHRTILRMSEIRTPDYTAQQRNTPHERPRD